MGKSTILAIQHTKDAVKQLEEAGAKAEIESLGKGR